MECWPKVRYNSLTQALRRIKRWLLEAAHLREELCVVLLQLTGIHEYHLLT